LLITVLMPQLDQIIEEITDLQYAGGKANHEKVIALATEHIDGSAASAALLNMRGVSERVIGQYEKAEKDYLAVLATDDAHSEKIRAFVNLADIYRVAKANFVGAHEFLLMADLESKPDSLERVLVLNQRALVYTAEMVKDPGNRKYAIANYERAKKICDQSLDIKTHRESRKRYADVLSGLAYLQNDPEKAIDLGRIALIHYEVVKDLRGQFNTLCNLGRTMLDQGDYHNANLMLEDAWSMALKENEPRAMATIALDLSELYFRTNKLSTGRYFYSRFDELKDSALTLHDNQIMQPQIDHVKELYQKS
jgi:tetratricopeptide (TPR) repeat protein